jgi:tetratricopeptide (TPR) repeat protein
MKVVLKEKNMKMFCLLSKLPFMIVVMCLFPLVSISQNKMIDSLKSLLPSNSLIKQADILYGLAYEYVDLDFKLGLLYATEAFEVAKGTGDSLRIVKAGRIKSLAFRRLNKIDSSMIISIQILPIARRNYFNEEMESILNGLALAYTFEAFYDKALKCFFELLELRQKGGGKSEISVALHGIGLVYYKLKDFDNAISYFKRAVQLKKEVNERYDMDLLLNNIGLCYAYKDNFAVAKDYIMQAFTFCNSTCSKVFLLHAHFSQGVIAFRQQNHSIAEIQFLKSYDLAKQLNDERYQLDNIIFLLAIYIIKNQGLLAEDYLKKADKLIESESHEGRSVTS